ncbi:Protein CutA 1, chloroplastic [Zostera marina]|uniref:Protein CutA 1, chloroplastic n=1 Tax=Zostera marina TaxID=29655 RepID=A0A0K9PHA0_ZOSMR|nr:Protein CutA 1, chloroplastic [Zostera marina]
MAFLCLKAFSSPSVSPYRAAPSTLLLRRRLPLIGTFCVLSFSAIAAITCYNGRLYPHNFPTFLWPKNFNLLRKGIHSTKMAAESSTTVPSIVAYVTVPNREAGKKLAESIVKEKLAACVNVVPGIQSVYWWDDKIQTDTEELLIIKTRESLLTRLIEHVKSNHEYDVPEVISLPITGGNDKYLEWIKNSTRE